MFIPECNEYKMNYYNLVVRFLVPNKLSLKVSKQFNVY